MVNGAQESHVLFIFFFLGTRDDKTGGCLSFFWSVYDFEEKGAAISDNASNQPSTAEAPASLLLLIFYNLRES